MTAEPDNSAFVALSKGRAAGADALWSVHAARLHAYARAVLSRSDDQHHAEDVVQQVFLSVMKLGPKRARAVRNVEAWLVTATRTTSLNIARGERRERSRRRKVPHVQAGPNSAHEHIRSMVERLPPDEAEVVALRHGFGLSYDLIAESIGSKKSTVASRHARAVARLKTMLASDLDEAAFPESLSEHDDVREVRRA